jgi:hypothetical protein
MTIRIVKCSDAMFWYADFVGCEFVVICEDIREYIVRTPGGYSNIVKKLDAIII